MRIRKLNHSIYQIKYHIVWGTKYRRKFIKPYVKRDLVGCLFALIQKNPEWYIEKINTGADHVHMLIEIPPKNTVSEVVQKMKASSSVYLKRQYGFIKKIYDDKGIWSVGYYVSTVGLNEQSIKKYIEKQDKFDVGEEISAEFS